MNFKIIEEKEIPLLNRKNIIAELDYGKIATPKNTEVVKIIADNFKIKEDLIALQHIYPIFGQNRAKIIAHIYKTAEDLQKIEKIKKRAKKKVKVVKAKEAETK